MRFHKNIKEKAIVSKTLFKQQPNQMDNKTRQHRTIIKQQKQKSGHTQNAIQEITALNRQQNSTTPHINFI